MSVCTGYKCIKARETWLGEEQAAWPVSPSTASHLLLWILPGARASGEEGLGDFSLGSDRIVPSCWLSSQLVSFPTQPSQLPLQSCFWWFSFFFFQRNKKNLLYREKHPDTLTHPLDRKSLPAPQVQPILRALCCWGPVPVCGVDLGVCGWAWGPRVWVSVRHGL